MALEMRQRCERCGVGLGAHEEAFICAFECTFCRACTTAMARVCPRCGGELMSRPRRAFDRQPTLTGPLLELRPLRPDDWAGLFAVAADPLIWEQHPESDRYQENVFRRFFDEALKSGGALVALERASGEIVGSSRYHWFDAAHHTLEIGWTFLARRCWGGRYNGEMKRLMLEHAFQSVDRVVFVVGPENRRSRRAVEKIGGVYAGFILDPKGRERVIYELTRVAYAAARDLQPARTQAGEVARQQIPRFV